MNHKGKEKEMRTIEREKAIRFEEVQSCKLRKKGTKITFVSTSINMGVDQ